MNNGQPPTAGTSAAAETDWAATSKTLARVLRSPVRRQMLRILHAAKLPQSPKGLSEKVRRPLGVICYHVNILKTSHAIVLTDTQEVKGAVEHFYVSALSDRKDVLDVLAETKSSDSALY